MLYDLSRLSPAIRGEIENNDKLKRLFSSFPSDMFSVSSDAKTVKGEKKGFLTAIMYLSPFTISGENMCANAALAACHDACLYSAGRGRMATVSFPRLRKTLFWQQYNDKALRVMAKDLDMLKVKAKYENMTPCVRPNGTSDIRMENYGIIQEYNDLQWYDYTKLANRKNIPANYDLTFSYSGAAGYQSQVDKALENGMRIAAVFRNKDMLAFMVANGSFMGRSVIDADESDLRFLEPSNVIAGLAAKGNAKLDGNNFVIDYGHEGIAVVLSGIALAA